MSAAKLVAAIHHGTTSTRCILFARDGTPAAIAQREQTMYYPRAGWVEIDGLDELRANYAISRRWEPGMDDDTRTAGLAGRRRGVDRTLGLAAPEPVGAGAA
jgi:glycerol kinase